MKLKHSFAAAFVSITLVAGAMAQAKDKQPVQTGWVEVINATVDVRSKPSVGKKSLARLSPGALVAAYESKQSGSVQWTKVSTANPATLEPVTGWVESGRLQVFPKEQFPSDEELQKVLGGAFLEDIHTQDMRMLRYVLRRGDQEPLLLVYIGSTFLPQTRLQTFVKKDGNWAAGPSFEYMPFQLKTGVAEIEIRDLLGDRSRVDAGKLQVDRASSEVLSGLLHRGNDVLHGRDVGLRNRGDRHAHAHLLRGLPGQRKPRQAAGRPGRSPQRHREGCIPQS